METKKIEITFSVSENTTTIRSVVHKNLTVYNAVTSLESLAEGLKLKLGQYMKEKAITPETKNFHAVVEGITIEDLRETENIT